jgi:cation/acetate symporter
MPGESFKWLPVTLLAGALAAVLFIGLASRVRKGEYELARSSTVGPVGIGAAIASNWMSAASFLGIAGIFYLQGYFALAYVVGWTGGYVLLLVLMGGQLRRFGKYTAPDFVEARYDSPVARLLSAIVAILISLIYCVAQYKGIGLVFAWMFGLDYTSSLVLGVTVAVSYLVIAGGLGAVRGLRLHYVILLLCFLLPLMAIARKLGYFWPLPQIGYGQALQDLQARVGNDFSAPWAFGTPYEWLALCFTLMVGTAGLPHVLARFYTLPNLRDARWSVLWGILFIGLLYWSAPAYGTFALLTRPAAIGSDSLLLADLVVIKAAEWSGIPQFFIALTAVGACFAAFSTVSRLLVTGAGTFAYDIYCRLFHPQANERQLTLVAKGTTLVLALVVVVFALNPPGLIAQITAIAFALAGNTLFPAFLLGLWWDRTNKFGVVAGMLTGLLVTFAPLALGSLLPWLPEIFPPTGSALIGVPLVIAVIVLVSLATPQPPEAIRRFLAEKVHRI